MARLVYEQIHTNTCRYAIGGYQYPNARNNVERITKNGGSGSKMGFYVTKVDRLGLGRSSWFICSLKPLAVDVEEVAAAVPEKCRYIIDWIIAAMMEGEKTYFYKRLTNLFQWPLDSLAKSIYHTVMAMM